MMRSYGPDYGIIWEPIVHRHSDFLDTPDDHESGTIARCNCDKYLAVMPGEYGKIWYELRNTFMQRHVLIYPKLAHIKLRELGITL